MNYTQKKMDRHQPIHFFLKSTLKRIVDNFALRVWEIEKKFGEVPNFFAFVKMSSCNGLGEWRVPILQQALCVFARPLWEQIPCGA